ncbi:MAG: hypothetical protein ACE5E6_13060, partial [Phycisphaerae bacterium]
HDAVAAQVVIPRHLACHALLRTATGVPGRDRPTVGLDDVSITLRFVACLSAMSMTAATWMDSANADVPALKAVAARARRSLEKFDRASRQTDWLHPVTLNEEIRQGVAPCTRDLASTWSEGVPKRDVELSGRGKWLTPPIPHRVS